MSHQLSEFLDYQRIICAKDFNSKQQVYSVLYICKKMARIV